MSVTSTCGNSGKIKKLMGRIYKFLKAMDHLNIAVVVVSIIPMFAVVIVILTKQDSGEMADDGITTANDMLVLLMEAQEYCNKELKEMAAPLDEYNVPMKVFCPGEWDKLMCWPPSPPGLPVRKQCPVYIPDFNKDGFALRQCGTDGKWVTVGNTSRTYVDYTDCDKYMMPENQLLKHMLEGEPTFQSMITLYTVGYSFSLVALTFAMIILAYFPRLHCTRNYIHMHLFASFILRAIVIFVKDKVLFTGSGIMDMQTQNPEGELSLGEIHGNIMSENKIGCRIVITLFHYFLATNYYWILVEALYLHSLIFVAFFSDKKYLFRFTLTGWGVPILFVAPWAIVRASLKNENCWDIPVPEYTWIYTGPIVVANVINFLLFLNIIRVLWYKMQERGAIRRTDNRSHYKKLAKSTLVLIPMFGVHAIVFIGMPDDVQDGVWWKIRMYFDLFFNSFQGFFVAIIYCFCNGEVQAEFKKEWERFNLSKEMQKGRRERSRSSVTMLTSFNSSGSHQARHSIGGASGRSSMKPLNGTSHNNNVFYSNGHSSKMPLINKQMSLTTDSELNETSSLGANQYTTTVGVGENMCAESSLLTTEHETSTNGDINCNGSGQNMKLSNISSIDEEDVEEAEFERALDEAREESVVIDDDHCNGDIFTIRLSKNISSNFDSSIDINEQNI